jgi:hypothetical protein
MSRKELVDLVDICLSVGIGLTNESFAQTITHPPKDIFDERLKNMGDTLEAMDKMSMFVPEMVDDLKERYQISKTKYNKLVSA